MTGKRRNEKRDPVPVPSASDWGKIPGDDFDRLTAHELYFGKSCSELQSKFSRVPIAMIDSLRWMPARPFAYYLRCLAEFVMSDLVHRSVAPDLASSFLRLIEEKAKTCPAGIRANMNSVRDAVGFVAQNQARFDANLEIYGDFALRGKEIGDLLDKI